MAEAAAAEVVPAAVAPAAPVTAPATAAAPALNMDWRSHVPEDVRSDQSFTPIIDKISEKDIPSLVKSHLHLVRKMGNALTLPAKGAKAEEVGAFLDKVTTGFPREEAAALKAALRKSQFLPAIPESADKYEFTPPEGRELDKSLIGEVQKILHDGEVPQEVAGKLMDVYFKSTPDLRPIVDELKALVPALKQSKEEALTEYENEVKGNGHDPEQVKAVIGRFMAKNYSQEKMDLMGDYGSSPIVLDMAYKLALASGEDMGPINVAGAPEVVTPEAVEAEAIMYGHAGFEKQHEQWKSRGPAGEAMRARVQELFKKSTGGK